MKKTLAVLVCIALAVAGYIHVEGTLSAQIESEGHENVITQLILERSDNGLVPSDKTKLLPCVYADPAALESFSEPASIGGYDVRLWAKKDVSGAKDKFILVRNDGATACYFRTLIAFENSGGVFDSLVYLNWNTPEQNNYLFEAVPTELDINGQRYRLFALTYKEALGPGETAPPMLLQVAMDRQANNEDVAPLGETFELLAFTQALWVDHTLDQAAQQAEANYLQSYTDMQDLLGAGNEIYLEIMQENFAYGAKY